MKRQNNSELSGRNRFKNSASVPHVRPETPRRLTHTHDEDCSDDEDVAKGNK